MLHVLFTGIQLPGSTLHELASHVEVSGQRLTASELQQLIKGSQIIQ